MLVRELIEVLKGLPESLEVVILDADEGSYLNNPDVTEVDGFVVIESDYDRRRA